MSSFNRHSHNFTLRAIRATKQKDHFFPVSRHWVTWGLAHSKRSKYAANEKVQAPFRGS